MYKLRVRFSNFFRVSSVSLVDDQNAEIPDVLFSLKHKTVDRFFDEFGDFSPGEKKIGPSSAQGDGVIALKPDVFANVEEFDMLQIAIYSEDQLLHSSTFAWPDNSGNSELEIHLHEDVISPDIGEEKEIKPPKEKEIKLPKEKEIKAAKEQEKEKEPEPKPAWIKWVLTGAFMVATALSLLAYIIYERGFFDKNSALLNQENCTKTSYLKSAIETESKNLEFIGLCAERYSLMSETEFNDMLGAIPNQNSLLLERGYMYDNLQSDSFLKKLRPNTAADIPLAVIYYNEAKNANVSGASELLKNACSKLNTAISKFQAKEICEFSE